MELRRAAAATCLAAGLGSLACGAHAYRFGPAPPVLDMDDRRPIPEPRPTGFRHVEYLLSSTAEVPVVGALDVGPRPPAGDVNALDEVPASSWYTPRLGAREVTPEELLEGPRQLGAPRPPFAVTRVKTSGNPGFLVRDARDVRYLLKFDPPEFPGIETTTALVVSRLFWGFGYNVPEDDLVMLGRGELRPAPDAGVAEAEIDAVLAEVAPPVGGLYRATASRFLEGSVLGPTPARGRRADDPNDRVPHQNRRTLRALRMLGAFVNHSDMRPDNSLDVYVGEPGEGHVEHYLLDFGEAFGGHGAEHDRLWDGYESYLEFSRLARNLVTLGLEVAPWEELDYTPWASVGAFESRVFRPELWRETTPYPPIRASDAADDYWAAKRLGPLTREHLQTLVDAARYPEPEAARYMVDVLMERRQKVLDYALARVSPLEPRSVEPGELRLADVGAALMSPERRPATYRAELFDGAGRPLGPAAVEAGPEGLVRVRSERIGGRESSYLRVDVHVARTGSSAPPAQFHLRRDAGALRIAGVVH